MALNHAQITTDTLLLGKDLKKKLYDLHRDEDGIVDGEAVANDFVQILLDYKAGKNS